MHSPIDNRVGMDTEDRQERAKGALWALTELVEGQARGMEVNAERFGVLLRMVSEAVDDALPINRRPKRAGENDRD